MVEPSGLVAPLAPLSLPELRELRLDSGLTVVAAERGRVPLTSACLVLPYGSARDPRGKAGLTDFAVELLRRGTDDHSADKLDELLELMGVDLRLETAPDSTYVMATAPSEHLPRVLELMAELVCRPSFKADEVVQARKRTLARLQNDLDDPPTLASDALFQVALPKHPYGVPGRGRRSEVKTFTRADCVGLHKALFRPTGAHLLLVGDVPPREALELAEAAFAKWTGKAAVRPPIPQVKEIEGRRILLVDKPEATQAQIRLASAGPGRTDPQLIGTRVARQVLGGGFTSRLVEAIRVNRGLSYGVSSFLTDTEAGGLFVVGSYTKTESVSELIDVALEETARYRDQGPSDEELLRAQRYINGLFPLAMETVDQLARTLADVRRFGRASDWLERYRERVQAVTADQARTLARRYFLASGVAMAVVGNAKAIAPQLASMGKVKVIKVEALA